MRTWGLPAPPPGGVFILVVDFSPLSPSSSTPGLSISYQEAGFEFKFSLVHPSAHISLRTFNRGLQYSSQHIASVALLVNPSWTWTWTPPPPPQGTTAAPPCSLVLHLRTSTSAACLASTWPLTPAIFKFTSKFINIHVRAYTDIVSLQSYRYLETQIL